MIIDIGLNNCPFQICNALNIMVIIVKNDIGHPS